MKHPGGQNFVIPTLVKHYSVETFLDMVEAAMKNPNTKKIAKKLQEGYLSWSLQIDDSPQMEFYLLVLKRAGIKDMLPRDGKISQASYNFLSSPHFKLWRTYLDRFNKMHPDKKTTVIATLEAHYTDEALVQMLALAKKDPSTEKVATNLQLQLLNTWARELKDPTEVSKLLVVGSSDALIETYARKFNWAINSAGDKLFDKPQLDAWLKYVKFYKAKQTGPKLSTNEILTARYGDEALAKMIAALKLEPGTKNIARRMQSAQLPGWMTDRKSPKEVFRLQNLKRSRGNLFANLLFRTCQLYLDRFNNKYPDEKATLLGVLINVYDDGALSKIIIAAKSNTRTSAEATALQKEQLALWHENSKAPSSVFRWLQVKGTAGDNAERLLYLKYREDYKLKVATAPLVEQ